MSEPILGVCTVIKIPHIVTAFHSLYFYLILKSAFGSKNFIHMCSKCLKSVDFSKICDILHVGIFFRIYERRQINMDFNAIIAELTPIFESIVAYFNSEEFAAIIAKVTEFVSGLMA